MYPLEITSEDSRVSGYLQTSPLAGKLSTNNGKFPYAGWVKPFNAYVFYKINEI